MKRFAVILLATVVALSCGVAHANDSSFGGSGAALVPLKETRVKMVSENILLDRTKDKSSWHVSATYVFKNPTDKKVSLQIGFPEQHCEPESDCFSDKSGIFQGLVTKVRGQRVKVREGKVKEGTAWAPSLGKVYLFDVTFQPNERLEIVHSYRYDRSVSVDSVDMAYYVTRTGALWNGPIGHATFTVRLPYRPWSARVSEGYKLLRFEEKLVHGVAVSELVFDMKNWTPKEDLDVSFGNDYLAMPSYDCPVIKEAIDGTADARLKTMNKEELRRCRNLPYARHGYPFKSKDLRDYFYAPSTTGDIVSFKVNPHFSPKMLSLEEQKYIAVIKKEERRRGQK